MGVADMSFQAFHMALSLNCRRREIFNNRLTWRGFDFARLSRLAMCVVVSLNAPVAVAANMYTDWAQKNAVNLNGQTASTDAATMIRASSASTESEASRQCIARPAAYDLLNGINDVNCNNANLRDAIISADVPSTFQGMKDRLKENPTEFHALPPEESLYHNMKENAPLRFPMSTLDSLILGAKLKSEYKTLLKSVRDGVPIRSEDFTYLDPSMPNVKYVSFDNHREVVYNRTTGDRIRTGINAGTANEASANRSVTHVQGDIPRYGRCQTPSAEQVALGEELARHTELVEWLAKNPDLLDDILNGDISDPKSVVRSLEDKMSRIRQKTKNALLGNDAKDVIEPDQRRDEARCDIDTSKLESLLKERINMLEQFIAQLEKGKRLGKHDKSRYEGIVKESLLEVQRIDKQIKSLDVPDDKRRKIEGMTIGNVKSLLDKVVELEARLEKLAKKSDDVNCQCTNPRPYAFNGNSSIPGWANCENCGRQVGVTLNGKIISNNPLTNGKEPRWVTWEEANKISERFKEK